MLAFLTDNDNYLQAMTSPQSYTHIIQNYMKSLLAERLIRRGKWLNNCANHLTHAYKTH